MKVILDDKSEYRYDCECCGSIWDDTTSIYLDDTLVYEKVVEGHFGGGHAYPSGFSNPIEELADHIQLRLMQDTRNEHTEEKRHEWNMECPGNYVASTEVTWKEREQTLLEVIRDDFKSIKRKIIPIDEMQTLDLKIRMLLLLIENEVGERIDYQYNLG